MSSPVQYNIHWNRGVYAWVSDCEANSQKGIELNNTIG